MRSDVFVVGGGPAGLASAIAFAQKGYRVTVGDCGLPPIEKACGEGLMPNSLAALGALGIQLEPDQGAIFRGIRFIENQSRFEATFPDGPARGLRRITLQKLLIDRTEQLGVELRWGLQGIDWRDGKLTVAGRVIETGLTVAADGHNSNIRRAARLDAAASLSWRYAYRRHYAMRPWTDHTEIYWANGYQIFATPVSSGEVCVVVTSQNQALRLDEALCGIPELAERLRHVPYSREMGALTTQRHLKRIWRKGLALAGDASGSVDSLTGEGLRLAFEGALALSGAHAACNLAAYQTAHEEFFRRPRLMASLLLTLERFPAIRRRVFAGFAKRPDVFANALGLHIGATSVLDFKPGQLLGFGLDFLAA